MIFNRFHKTVFALAAVIGPLYWLTMTDDGQRRVDSTLLSLTGKPTIDFNLKAMDSHLTETELQRVFPDQDWRCVDQPSPLGQRLCVSQIGVFNGLPANYLTFFFTEGRASALKLAYRPIYHQQLLQQLFQLLGQPDQHSINDSAVDDILQWSTAHGSVVMKHTLQPDDEAALLWMAAAAHAKKHQ